MYTEAEVKNLLNEIEKIKTGLSISRRLAKTADKVINSSAMDLTVNIINLKSALEDFDSSIETLGE